MAKLTIKQKLKVLSYIRKELLNENTNKFPIALFLCTEFGNAVALLGYYEWRLPDVSEAFIELEAEIIRIGFENNSEYMFPGQLYFKNDKGEIVETNDLAGKSAIWYNKIKLEMVSRVRKQLTKGKY